MNQITKTKNIAAAIDALDQPYSKILFLKYISGYTMEEVALAINYSIKRTYQLHEIAVPLFAKRFKTDAE